MAWQKVSSSIIWVSSEKKLQKGLSTLTFRFAWISNVKVLKQIDFWVSPPLPPHSIKLKSSPRLINLFPSLEHVFYLHCDMPQAQSTLWLLWIYWRRVHTMFACTQPSSNTRRTQREPLPEIFFLICGQVVWALSLSVGTARAGANSPGANKLAARARRRRGENCVQLELADLVETKLSKAAVERAKSYRRCWMQILLGGAGKTLLRGFDKQRRRPAAGNFEKSCRKLELCTASPGHSICASDIMCIACPTTEPHNAIFFASLIAAGGIDWKHPEQFPLCL